MARRALSWQKAGPSEYREAGGRFVLCATRLPRLGVHWHLYDRGVYVFHSSLKGGKDEAERRAKE